MKILKSHEDLIKAQATKYLPNLNSSKELNSQNFSSPLWICERHSGQNLPFLKRPLKFKIHILIFFSFTLLVEKNLPEQWWR